MCFVVRFLMVGETKIRVRYAETDQMGVVYHSNFIIWFEVGRVELQIRKSTRLNSSHIQKSRMPSSA